MDDKVKKATALIQDFYKRNKRPPTYEEIASLMGFSSKNASYKLVDKLVSLDILERDKAGKIIPKNLFGIPREQQDSKKEVIINTDYLRNAASDLLDATHPLAEAHPLPNSEDSFLRIIEATFRRNTFTLLAIVYLSKKPLLSDSAMDLMRKMLEDTISIEYMIANGKDEMSKRFKRFLWMQINQNAEFMETLDVDFSKLGLEQNREEIENNYKDVRKEFVHKPTGNDLRSWIGKDFEAMLKDLKEKGVLDDFDISRTTIGYIRGSWKNHFNPYDVHSYLSSDLLEASAQEAANHALLLGTTSLYRLATRYIDHIRELAQENKYEDVAQEIKKVWSSLNPE